MSDTVNKKLVYGIEADFAGLNKGIGNLLTAFKGLDKTFKDVGKQFADVAKKIKSDASSLEKPFQDLSKNVNKGFKDVVTELKHMSSEMKNMKNDMKNTLGYVQMESQKTGKAINRIAQETTKTGKAVQAGMGASAKAMKSFAAENQKTQTQLRGFANEANNADDKLTDLRSGLSGAVQSFGMVAAAISGALTMGIRSVMKEFGDFEHQLKVFEAVSQSTAGEMDAIKQKALDIGASTKYTATEVAAASVELSKMGFNAKETTDALDGMVSASIASGESLEDTSAIIATTIRTFGMAASDSTKVADIIARGANISAQSFKSFSDSMRYVGSAAAGANQDLVQTSGLLAVLADRGIKSTVAGNGLQNALLRLQAPTDAAREAMAKLNLSIADTKGTASTADDTLRPMLDIIKDIKKSFADKGVNQIEQAGILKDMFGEVALNTMQVFMNTHNDVIDGVMAKQEDYAGSSKEAADKISESFNEGVLRMQSAISALKISIGEELAPTMSMLADIVGGIAEKFNSIPGPIKSVLAHLTLLLAGATAALAGGAGVAFLANQAVTAFVGLNTFMGGTLVSGFMGSIGAIAKVVTGLVTGPLLAFAATAGSIYLAFKTNFGGLRDIMNDFTSFLVGDNNQALQVWGADIEGLLNGLKMAWAVFTEFLANQFLTMLGLFDHAASAFLKMIGNVSRALGLLMSGDLVGAKAESDNALTALKEMGEILTLNEVTIKRFRERARGKFFPGLQKELDATKDAQTKTNKVLEKSIDLGNTVTEQKKTQAEIVANQLENELKLLEVQKTKALTGANNQQAQNIQITDQGGPGPRTSGFGMRVHPITGVSKPHTGVDYGAPAGSPIKSDADGTVVFSGWKGTQTTGYGQAVIVDVGNGNYMLYGHASKLYKQVGDRVKKGDTLAAVGSTGASTGPHLHKEFRTGGTGKNGNFGTPIDPANGLNGTGGGETADQVAERFLAKEYEILLKHQQRLKQLTAAHAAGTKERIAAEKELAAVSKLVGDIELEASAHHLSLVESRKKADQDYAKWLKDMLDDQIESIEKSFDETKKKTEDLIDGLTKKTDDLKLNNLFAGMSDEDKKGFEEGAALDEMIKEVAKYKESIEGISGAVKEIQGSQSQLTGDQKEKLAGLTKEYEKLQDSIKKVDDAAQDYVESQGQNLANKDLDDYLEQMAKTNKEGVDFIKALKGNDDALQEFNSQLEEGEISLEGFQEKFGLTNAQMDELIILLAQADFEKGFNRGINNAKKEMTEAEKAAEELAKTTKSVQNGLIDAVFMLGRAISDMVSESNQGMATVLDGLMGIGSGVIQMFKGDIIGGAITAVTSVFDTVYNLINRNQRAMIEYNNELARGGIIDAQSQTQALEGQLNVSQRSGDSPQYIKSLKDEIAKSRAAEGMAGINASIQNSGYAGMNIPKDANGVADFDAMVKQLEDQRAYALRVRGKLTNEETIWSQKAINDFKLFAQQAKGIAQQLNSDLSQNVDEEAQALTQTIENSVAAIEQINSARADYFSKLANDSKWSKYTDSVLAGATGGNDALNESMRPVAESISRDVQAMFNEVVTAFGGETPEAFIEFHRRLAGMAGDFAGRVSKIHTDAAATAAKEAEDKMKGQINALKDARTKLFDQDKAVIQNLIDIEQRRLDKINEENDSFEKQIRLKNKLRDQDLEKFDAQDQGIFAGMVSGVDYDSQLRQGLDDIHNPEGVLTGTYSYESHKEAMTERIALMTLENENKLKLEEITREEYLKNQQNIAAVQARFASEILAGETLNTRQRLEMERTKADAYVSFQQAYREAIVNRTEVEVSAIQVSISANNEQAEVIKANITAHQAGLTALADQYAADNLRIDDSVKQITESNDQWRISAESLKNGVTDSLQKIIDAYNRAKEVAAGGFGSVTASGGGGGSYNPYSSKPVAAFNPYSSKPVAAMATGGVVPGGFPNDSYPALLSSGEAVLPVWFTDMLKRHSNVMGSGMMGGAMTIQKNMHVELNGQFMNSDAVKRGITDAARAMGFNDDSAVNGAFTSTLN